MIAYTRKSSEGDDQQALSHEQQRDAIRAQYDDRVIEWFEDSKSGKTFDARPGYRTMLAWCQAHPQPRTAPGVIVMYAKDRFGRALIPGTDETDWDAWDEARLAFSKAGWTLEFLKSKRTGQKMVDRFLDTIEEEGASEYLRAITRNTSRGRADRARRGYWSSGLPPFPAVRADSTTGRILAPKERPSTGAGVILVPDPERLRHWIRGAELLLAREPWRAVLDYYQAHVPPARKNGRWTRAGLSYLYANEALVGTLWRRVNGRLERFQARWDPVVPPELFEAVQAELSRRNAVSETGRRERRPESPYLLRNLTCIHCGARYGGAYRRDSDRRYYAHPDLGSAKAGWVASETVAAMREAGCLAWKIPADDAERAVREAILAERGSPDWAATMRRLYDEAYTHRAGADTLTEECRRHLTEVKRALDANLAALDHATPETMPLILARVEQKNRELRDAQRALSDAEARATLANTAGDRAAAVVDETLQVVRAWESGSHTDRQRIIDWWVRHLAVEIARVPGRRQGAVWQKTLHIRLATTPREISIELPRAAKESLS